MVTEGSQRGVSGGMRRPRLAGRGRGLSEVCSSAHAERSIRRARWLLGRYKGVSAPPARQDRLGLSGLWDLYRPRGERHRVGRPVPRRGLSQAGVTVGGCGRAVSASVWSRSDSRMSARRPIFPTVRSRPSEIHRRIVDAGRSMEWAASSMVSSRRCGAQLTTLPWRASRRRRCTSVRCSDGCGIRRVLARWGG